MAWIPDGARECVLMVVDTSAVLAIMLGEPERARFLAAVTAEATRPAISAMTVLEAALVLAGRYGETVLTVLDGLVETLFEVVPFGEADAWAARTAYLRFGKGRHPAGLNFGDCASYALAKRRETSLLFKGEDFARTDIMAAIA